MGVDGIGSGGSRPPVGIDRTETAETSRGVGRAEDSSRPGSAAPAGSAALQSLERGDIDVEAYLDQRVAEATRHLEAQLPASEVAFVREALRAELASDPVLVELAQRTTGRGPARVG